MLDFFQKDKVKDIIVLIDNHVEEEFSTGEEIAAKKQFSLDIFDNLKKNDYVSLITISRKVKWVYSLSEKSKNTTQLRNQLASLSWDKTKRWNFVKGISTGINELRSKGNANTDNYLFWITSSNDLKSFQRYKKEELLLIQEAIKISKINIIFIIWARDEKEFEGLIKFVKYICEDSLFLVNPTQKAVIEIVKSITNVNVLNDDLVFERFD
jgi:hypothetical protein